MGLIKVKIERDHENEFGRQRKKTKGGSYEAPPHAAQSLKANGFVSYADTNAAQEALLGAGLPAPSKATDEPAKA
jgi:hypothetical protein